MEESDRTVGHRRRVWFLCALIVFGSVAMAVVHISTGLHAQLLANRKMVRTLREQLAMESDERNSLLREGDGTVAKLSSLRAKSKGVTEELLDQQHKSRHLAEELLLAREDLAIAGKNCSLTKQRMMNKYQVTLRALHDRVVQGQECRSLLQRNLEERGRLESSLGLMQDRAFNATSLLKSARQKLREVVTLASSQADQITRMESEIASLKSALAAAGEQQKVQQEQHQASQQQQREAANEAASSSSNEEPSAEAVLAAWKSHVDKKTGRTYWFNSLLKKSQWETPSGVVA